MSVQTPSRSSIQNRTAETVSTLTSTFPAAAAWVRPVDWLTLPAITDTDQKFVGLFAVFPGEGNFVAVRAQTDSGTYTVDWGDGTSVTKNSNEYAYYQFDYTNSAFDGTLTTQGYKQTIVTVTPDTGNLTFLRVDEKNTQSGLNNYTNGWLDIAVAGSYLSYVGIAQATNPIPRMLQQAKIYKVSDTTCTDYGYMFVNCYALRSVPVLYVGNAVTNMGQMFQSCWSLTETPTIDFKNVQAINSMFLDCKNLLRADLTTPYVNDFDSTFQDCPGLVSAIIRDAGSLSTSVAHLNSTFDTCYGLVSATIYKTSNVDSMQSTFNYCESLKTVIIDPNTTILTATNNMFTSCSSLVEAPVFNTSNVTSMSTMFGSCFSLLSAPLYDTSIVTNMQSMFDNCHSLRYLPTYNTSNVTNMYGIVNTCNSLLEFPNWDLSSVTSSQYMFANCPSLISVPTLNLPNVLYTSAMFDSVRSLESVTLNIGTSIISMDNMFSSSVSLLDVTINGTFPALTNVTNMFSFCYALRTAPLFDTSNVTDFSGMFYQARGLKNVPLYNTSNGTNFNSMFRACISLQELPTFNTTNGTAFQYMYESTYALVNIPPCDYSSNGLTFTYFASSSYTIRTVPVIDLTNATETTGMFGSCYSLQDASNIANAQTTISFNTCQLGNIALNTIYTNLGTGTGQTITVVTNWGTGTDDPTIATAKGWTVTG